MRVIAGSAKGRELIAPKGMHTRPTLAKVKEAMFGMVQFDIPGASVLDLFSGSGALGIEALSRGAERAVFCDADRQAASVVKSNLKRLGFEDARGTLFYEFARLIKESEPKVFIFENVKGLYNHDKGRTWSVMCDIFQECKASSKSANLAI